MDWKKQIIKIFFLILICFVLLALKTFNGYENAVLTGIALILTNQFINDII